MRDLNKESIVELGKRIADDAHLSQRWREAMTDLLKPGEIPSDLSSLEKLLDAGDEL